VSEQEEPYIEAVIGGDQQAFSKLVEKYQNMVFHLCLQILKSRESAEEAAQDAFVKAYRKLHLFERRSSFKTWLYRITYRTAVDYSRKRAMHFEDTDEVVERKYMASDEAGPLQKMIQDEKGDLILEGIRKLKPDLATIITLFYLEEKSVKEIGKIMRQSESNIKIKLFRARKQLKEIFVN
jgi:RNA polymerase sigma-70 factor (ECF subfamily)